MQLNKLYFDFITSEKASGITLLFCTALSLLLANSAAGQNYLGFWHLEFFSKTFEFWINDGLMTLFFLMVGLEIERELKAGELADLRQSLLPVFAAIGGMLAPALIYCLLNFNSGAFRGFGIPMATDIAFSLAVLSLLGKKVPASLKVFLTALAIIDDLGAIVIIAFFYSKSFSLVYLLAALGILIFLLILKRLKVLRIWFYLIPGLLMWYCMYRSGIHATITGVILAFAIPFGKGENNSLSFKLQHRLHRPVAFIVLPLFALANTAIVFPASVFSDLGSSNSTGIILGLCLGKPLGIFCFSMLAVMAGWCALPADLKKKHLLWTGFVAGIGFTMSIFIALLAFDAQGTIAASKIATIAASILAGLIGWLGLNFSLRQKTKSRQAKTILKVR